MENTAIMASLAVPGGSLNLHLPLISSFSVVVTKRGSRGRVNSTRGSLRTPPSASYETALAGHVSSLRVAGRNLAFDLVGKVRFRPSSSSSRSLVWCSDAKSRQDDDRQQQQQKSGELTLMAESVESRGAVVLPAEEREKQDFRRLREELEFKRKSIWHNFKDWHVVYKSDVNRWGLGYNPIFTVHEDADGNPFKVDIAENEILLRIGVDPNMMGFADAECKALAEKRTELAKGHARDIVLGLVNLSPLSNVYVYKREGARNTFNISGGSWPRRLWNPSGDAQWQVLSLLIVLVSVSALGTGVQRFFIRQKQDEDLVFDKKKLLSMRVRKLKAQQRRESPQRTASSDPSSLQLNRENGVAYNGTVAGEFEMQSPKHGFGEIVESSQSLVSDENFRKKVSEIQSMARKARLQEQENAGARSAQSFERKKLLQEEMKERRALQRPENFVRDLDYLRRLGTKSSDDPHVIPIAVKSSEEQEKISEVKENGQSSTPQASAGDDNYTRKRLQPNYPALQSTGVKPRIILSIEEAKARIAAKRVRSSGSSSASPSSKPKLHSSKVGLRQPNSNSRQVQPPEMKIPGSAIEAELGSSQNLASLSVEDSSKVVYDGVLDIAAVNVYPAGGGSIGSFVGDVSSKTGGESDMFGMEESNNVSRDSANVFLDKDDCIDDRTTEDSGGERGQWTATEEEEEMEWMRDEVLREIVFKVQANEEAGREPFHNLNSEQETLFFKGLERKFEREGDEVKKWVKDRVENIDYGLNGIGIDDLPESYELKWKESRDRSPKSAFHDRFSKDRDRIINGKTGVINTSPPVFKEISPTETTDSSSSFSSSHASQSETRNGNTVQGRSRESFPKDSKTDVVSSSPRTGETILPHKSIIPSTMAGEAGKENWAHTKRWAKDLEIKYTTEKDPATRALMREIGQDLDRWITEDEIEVASKLLNNGIEGEEEYARMHYEKTKEKIKKQVEMFGPEALRNKYSKFKQGSEEAELWWLSLPFVVCVGLRATGERELQTGLYSVNMAAALDGVPGLPNVPFHTVAFQDQGDARRFCMFVDAQPEKLGVDGAEPVPFDPKELYKDAKAEGFKVTVIKKGQLRLSVDRSFEEVEGQILELGSARYYDELLRDRVIDMGSVVDDFGRHSE